MLSEKSKLAALIVSALFLTALKYIIDSRTVALSPLLQLITHTTLLIAGGLTVLNLCAFLGVFTNMENTAISHLLRRVSEDPARNFFLGFLLTSYLNLVRPFLAFNLLFLPYIEWVAIALALYSTYSMTNFSSEDPYVSTERTDWKKHSQEVKRETGRDLIRITSIMKRFVDRGEKEQLLMYLALHMQRLGKTEEDIFNTLGPLIEYQNLKRTRLTFPWKKRKLVMQDRKNRENLLNTLIQIMDRLEPE